MAVLEGGDEKGGRMSSWKDSSDCIISPLSPTRIEPIALSCHCHPNFPECQIGSDNLVGRYHLQVVFTVDSTLAIESGLAVPPSWDRKLSASRLKNAWQPALLAAASASAAPFSSAMLSLSAGDGSPGCVEAERHTAGLVLSIT